MKLRNAIQLGRHQMFIALTAIVTSLIEVASVCTADNMYCYMNPYKHVITKFMLKTCCIEHTVTQSNVPA